ncbi:MAG: TIGR03915 family putative DNA repair protein [Elusimicrobia bacterium]|nr:TIGR03915 family putative DNA repair protein [Elusimicrobiota bacterium]
MRTYLYDGTFTGFLTALALALERGGEDCALAPEKEAGERDLFSEYVNAGADPAGAAAMRELFERRGSPESWRHARYAFLSEVPGAGNAVLAYARLLLEKGAAADDMLADGRVKLVHGLSASVAGEAHMFKGFARFTELADGSLYARIEPEHDILRLITGHFRARLGGFNWVIHDARRNSAALHFGGRLIYAPLDSARLKEDAREAGVRDLWRHFFKTAAIKERTNPALQRRNVPLKYRRNLTEFFPD